MNDPYRTLASMLFPQDDELAVSVLEDMSFEQVSEILHTVTAMRQHDRLFVTLVLRSMFSGESKPYAGVNEDYTYEILWVASSLAETAFALGDGTGFNFNPVESGYVLMFRITHDIWMRLHNSVYPDRGDSHKQVDVTRGLLLSSTLRIDAGNDAEQLRFLGINHKSISQYAMVLYNRNGAAVSYVGDLLKQETPSLAEGML